MTSIKNRAFLFFLVIIYSTILHAQNNLSLLNQDFANGFSTSDTLFKSPYIDKDEWRDKPIRHRYIHGGFKGNETRFSFYFPTKEKYQGRFFQYFTPFPDSETLAQNGTGEDDIISFSSNNGGYFIETNEGGKIDFAKPRMGADATIAAYRANAASAQFSRIVAAKVYGNDKRPYGYGFGGSGGAYRTIGSIENTEGVWDGVVPFVIGSPMAIPSVFTARMNAMRILDNKLPSIIDALEPGSKVDMYNGLNAEEREALQEVTKLGFPPKAWFAYKTMGIHGFIALYQAIVGIDNKYFTNDFWNVHGYLGANPPESLMKARIQQASKVKAGIPQAAAISLGLVEAPKESERGTADAATKNMSEKEGGVAVAFQLESTLPNIQFLGGDLIIKSGAAAGKTLQAKKIVGDKVVLGPADPAVVALIKVGDEVQVDNSNFLAVQTYHRHQVPPNKEEYPEWNQFRDSSGKPIYPQRPMLLGPLFTQSASGVLPKGKFKGKIIVLESLWDSEAFPWQADWYRTMLQKNMGSNLDDNFRLWFTDHANHGDLSNPNAPTHLVSYLGVLHQALLDVSTWVEKNIPPATSTAYKIEDGQVIVPAAAKARHGIQPIIMLQANGGKRAEVKVGQAVNFTATIELPANTGQIVSAEWDFDGAGTFPVKEKLTPTQKTGEHVTLKATQIFHKAGTYFVTLKAVSQRQGNASEIFTRIPNLDRVRVVVE